MMDKEDGDDTTTTTSKEKTDEEEDFEYEYESFANLLSKQNPILGENHKLGMSESISGFEGTSFDRSEEVRKRMNYLTCMSAIGGFLFGYDTGVISGAMLPISRIMSLSDIEEEIVVSSTILSACISSLVLGSTCNQYYGRRFSILISAAVFTLGSIILAFSVGFGTLVIGRIVVGIGIGLASLTTPIYIAEVAVPSKRGKLVTINALFVCFGQFISGMVDGVFSVFEENGWRFMLGLAVIPSAIMFHGFYWYLPESPRWLASRGLDDEALNILLDYRCSNQEAEQEMKEILDGNFSNHSSKKKLHSRNTNPGLFSSFQSLLQHQPTKRALVVGCGLMMLQQFCGINTIMYYAATIYSMCGFDENTSIWLSGFTSLSQSVSLVLSIYLIEKTGRRKLILISLFFVSLSLLGLSLLFYFSRISSDDVLLSQTECQHQQALVWSGDTKYCYDCIQIPECGFDACENACVLGNETNSENICFNDTCEKSPFLGYLSILLMILYLLSFGIGMGGLPWTVNSEIYPLQYRSIATSISTATNWISNMIISATFLSLSSPSGLTQSGAFFLYFCIAFSGVVWIYFVLPETKGKSLEEIEQLFRVEEYPVVAANADCDESLDFDYGSEDEITTVISEHGCVL